MKKKRRNIFSYVILSVWSLIIIGILGWVLMSSFKTNLEIYQTPWAMPAKATLENYHSAWSTMKMSSYFMNSVVIVFASILGCTVISALTSFALTRYEFKGRNVEPAYLQYECTLSAAFDPPVRSAVEFGAGEYAYRSNINLYRAILPFQLVRTHRFFSNAS